MLNSEQQQMVESSIWVVNTALKKQGLEKDKDLKQDALLYMCQCAERFDKTQGVKWTTYAYKNVYLFIKRNHAKEMKRKSALIDQDLFDMNENLLQQFEEDLFNNPCQRLKAFMSKCSPQQQTILTKGLEGYTIPEIALQINISNTQVANRLRGVKQKAREMYYE